MLLAQIMSVQWALFLLLLTNVISVVEPLVVFGFAYEAYVLAEMFHFSGIIR